MLVQQSLPGAGPRRFVAEIPEQVRGAQAPSPEHAVDGANCAIDCICGSGLPRSVGTLLPSWFYWVSRDLSLGMLELVVLCHLLFGPAPRGNRFQLWNFTFIPPSHVQCTASITAGNRQSLGVLEPILCLLFGSAAMHSRFQSWSFTSLFPSHPDCIASTAAGTRQQSLLPSRSPSLHDACGALPKSPQLELALKQLDCDVQIANLNPPDIAECNLAPRRTSTNEVLVGAEVLQAVRKKNKVPRLNLPALYMFKFSCVQRINAGPRWLLIPDGRLKWLALSESISQSRSQQY
mmetsp:Transcript_64516/g.178884  ORF Transcript_64516/g.178884 Transcript_64516/m.178884 type:complete len:292 (+) Transcript_64516:386-1261(+)